MRAGCAVLRATQSFQSLECLFPPFRPLCGGAGRPRRENPPNFDHHGDFLASTHFRDSVTLSKANHNFENFCHGLRNASNYRFLLFGRRRRALGRFYRDKLGFTLRTKAEGFADFKTEHVAFALWEIDHIAKTVGISSKRAGPGVHKSIGAIELKKPAEVDALYDQLVARGVTFVSPPKDYPWQARCVYFTDPDEYIWEIYSWLDELGGKRFGEVSE